MILLNGNQTGQATFFVASCFSLHLCSALTSTDVSGHEAKAKVYPELGVTRYKVTRYCNNITFVGNGVV